MQEQGPFCQSCAMPMKKTELFGTRADGAKSEEYCTYCFQEGKFTEPDISMQEIIDRCVAIIGERNIMPEDEARDLMTKAIPTLKRWRKTE
ncbi:MAG: zinc ribbon domain-containing protein [Desulfatiglandaceae bacterium]|jgi:hypothetical protein